MHPKEDGAACAVRRLLTAARRERPLGVVGRPTKDDQGEAAGNGRNTTIQPVKSGGPETSSYLHARLVRDADNGSEAAADALARYERGELSASAAAGAAGILRSVVDDPLRGG